jgi:hypothetical protein
VFWLQMKERKVKNSTWGNWQRRPVSV